MTGIVTVDVLLCADALVCESPVPFLSLLICKLSSGAPTGQSTALLLLTKRSSLAPLFD